MPCMCLFVPMLQTRLTGPFSQSSKSRKWWIPALCLAKTSSRSQVVDLSVPSGHNGGS